jgi:hypothetical protein
MDFTTAVASGNALAESADRDLWKLAEIAAHVEVDGLGLARWEKDVGLTWGMGHVLDRIWRRWGGLVVTDRPAFLDAFMATAMPVRERMGKTG